MYGVVTDHAVTENHLFGGNLRAAIKKSMSEEKVNCFSLWVGNQFSVCQTSKSTNEA